MTSVGLTVVGVSIIFFVLFVEASVVIVCKFQRNRSTFEYEFEYEYECVANFMDMLFKARIRDAMHAKRSDDR